MFCFDPIAALASLGIRDRTKIDKEKHKYIYTDGGRRIKHVSYIRNIHKNWCLTHH